MLFKDLEKKNIDDTRPASNRRLFIARRSYVRAPPSVTSGWLMTYKFHRVMPHSDDLLFHFYSIFHLYMLELLYERWVDANRCSNSFFGGKDFRFSACNVDIISIILEIFKTILICNLNIWHWSIILWLKILIWNSFKKPVKTISLQFAVAIGIIWCDERDEVIWKKVIQLIF